MNRRWLKKFSVTCLVLLIVACATQGGALTGPLVVSAETGQPAPTGPRLYLPLVLRNGDGVVPPFGLEAFWRDPNPAASADLVGKTGASWTRAVLDWRTVQPQEGGAYNWTVPDSYLGVISTHHLSIDLLIFGEPAWAAVDPVNLPSGPIKSEHLGDFVKFVQAAVARYGRPPYNVKVFEMFNEPEGTRAYYGGEIGTWGNYGAQYAEMLKAVYPAVKAVDPSAQVSIGGLAYANFTPSGPFVEKFLDDVLAAGGGAYFDLFNFHYYSPGALQFAAYGTDIFGKVNCLKQILEKHGVYGKPMIVSEMGDFGPSGDPAKQETQAQYVAKVYARGMSAGIRVMNWFALIGGTAQTGLIDDNGVRKPAYTAYQTLTSRLSDQRFSRVLSAQEVSPNAGAPVPAFEGYAFHRPGEADHLWVVWVNQGSAAMVVRARTVEVIDKFNNRRTLEAGSDGLVHLTLSTSPIYVRF